MVEGVSFAPGCTFSTLRWYSDPEFLMKAHHFSLAEGCSCIHMKSVEVPDHTPVSSIATLRCNYHLGKDKLYSVKWYKDSSEFYRLSLGGLYV